jgi:hypothetical protein
MANNAKLRQEQMTLLGSQMQSAASIFGSLGQMAEQFGGKQSAAYRAMFVANKAATIANAIISIQGAIAQAANTPFPANLGAMALVASQTASIIGTIRSTNIQGMAHDGIDSIPREGTWLLDRGERVVDARTNADLKQYLQQRNGGGGGGITVVINESSAAQVRVTEGVGADGQPMLTLDVVERVADGVYNRNLSRDLRPGGVLNGR